jgi:hypothetical protein
MQTVQRNQANGSSGKFHFVVIKAVANKLVRDLESKRYVAAPEPSSTGNETTDDDPINTGNTSPPKKTGDKSDFIPSAAGNQDVPVLPR